MERTTLGFDAGFAVRMATDEAQAAEMTLQPGERVGGPENSHPDSDQWLFVVSGSGVVTVDGAEHRVDSGDLLRIDAGERHAVANDGTEPLATLSFYTPPR